MRKKQIYIAVTNDLVTDNRVHKVASTLLKANADVTMLGRIKHNKTPLLNRSYQTRRFRLLFKKGPAFYMEYNFRLFLFLLFHRFDIVVANDLDTLPASFLASRIKFKHLVYDSHEYFTEVPELLGRKFPKKVWQTIEKMILPKLKNAYTVSESIAKTYYNLYGINLAVVRNVPNYIPAESVKTSNENNIKTILYQGSLNLGRGLEHLIDAMEHIDQAILKIIGTGDVADDLKNRVKSKSLNKKVEFLGQIPFEELSAHTKKADLGVALEENLGLNYYFALPNKLFDYIQARIPVLVSPFPEMQKIVNEYEIGSVYDHKNPQALATKINEIFHLEKRYSKWKENTHQAAQELCWENEEKILIRIYSKIGLNF